MAIDNSQIVTKIMSAEDEIVDLTSEMIAIPSVTGNEEKMALWVSDWLSGKGFRVESFEIDPEEMARRYPKWFYRWSFPYEGRPNILGRIPGAGGGKSLMINFHLDVVDASPEVWTVNPWEGTVKEGRLYGRGSSDMKGGAAAALYAVQSILDAGIRLKGDLVIAGVIEEEGPGNGTLAMQAHGVQADACIIPEPTELTLSIAVTGGIYGTVSLLGRSAHSTTPWEGVNALEKAYLLLKGIEKWRDRRRRIPLDSLFSHAPETPAASHMVDIARTDGGTRGRIPAAAEMMVRSTVMPGEEPEDLSRAFEETLMAEAVKDPWLASHKPSFSWMILGGRNQPAKLSEDHPLCQVLMKSFETVTESRPRLSGLVSPADMQHLMNIHPTTPTLMFGPGSIYDAHKDDESVPTGELVVASAVMADFILKWCGGC